MNEKYNDSNEYLCSTCLRLVYPRTYFVIVVIIIPWKITATHQITQFQRQGEIIVWQLDLCGKYFPIFLTDTNEQTDTAIEVLWCCKFADRLFAVLFLEFQTLWHILINPVTSHSTCMYIFIHLYVLLFSVRINLSLFCLFHLYNFNSNVGNLNHRRRVSFIWMCNEEDSA